MSHSKDMGKKNLHEDGGVRRQQLLSALKKFFKRPYKKVVPVAYALRGTFSVHLVQLEKYISSD